MKYDIILAGVGGQGILTVAYLLDNAAVNRGFRFKQAEVHGMAQRGGAVYSHMRISDEAVISDLIPEGRADMILSVEPLEVQRYLHFLCPKGVVVSSIQPFVNIPDYPPEEDVIAGLLRLPNAVLFNAKKIALASKSPRSENVAMVGAATPFLPFELEDFIPIIQGLFSAKGEAVVQANLDVLNNSYRAGLFYKEMLDRNVPNQLSYELITRLEPTSFCPELAEGFASALLANPGGALEVLKSLEGNVPCSKELISRLN